jgi:hypothetical protein
MSVNMVPEQTRVAEMEGDQKPTAAWAHYGMVVAGFVLAMNAAMVAFKRLMRGRRDGYEVVPTLLTV